MKVPTILCKHKLLTTVSLAYLGLAFWMPRQALLSFQNSLYYLFEMLMIMPVVFVLTSLIEGWVPKQAIINGFGERAGLRGNLLAFLLGSFSAGPIYAAFPVCKMLLRKGASVMNIVIVLSTWAVVKVPMLANEAKFLGPDFMILRWSLTTVSIFLMGYIISLRVSKADFPTEPTEQATSAETATILDYCIGCGLCARQVPLAFTIVAGKARVRDSAQSAACREEILAMSKRCPANAIEYRDNQPTE